ncbi:hypothetical protein [Phaffia rhodozyma]|uniref:Uncharacterized protein n=1 Tax=Phaffia rhodozyma TaxID=264483 RepID=A0A0F7SS70_PHARH|nr:hypothetical protein [Phaffia rhodozyma]
MSGTAFVAVAAMDTVLMVWGMLRRASGKKIWLNEYFENILLWLPWAIYVIFLPLNLVYTALNSETLYVSTMTCYADNVISFSFFAALIFDIWSVIMLLLHRHRVGKTTAAERDMEWSRRSYESTMTVNLPIISRVLLYSLSTLGGLLAAIILYVKPESHAPAVYQSTCGVSCFSIFGFQPDIWKKTYQSLRFLSTSVLKSQTSTSSPTPTRNQKENAQADIESGQDSSYGPNIDDLSDLSIQSRTCFRSIPLQTMPSGSRRRSESGSSFNHHISASDDDEYEKMEAHITLEESFRSGKTMNRSADQVEEGVVTCLAYNRSTQEPVEVEAKVGSSGPMESVGRSVESEAEVKLSARK